MAVYPGSRYADVPRHEHAEPGGRVVRHLGLRLIETPPARRSHRVQDGERTDHLAHRYFADPERYWRICDAQVVLWPEDLVAQPGTTVLVPSPED